MEMPVDRLYASVYLEDDEAYNIWRDKIGLPPERIVRLGKKDNFWEHGVGPCGPCSELHFDRGEAAGCGKPDCAVGCDCDRFMEFWNLVFIQFDKDKNDHYTPLPSPSIDTGMGLERMAMIMQGVNSVHEINTAVNIRNKVLGLANITGQESDAQRIAVNIIADHIRCTTVMASDGVRPGSEGRDYVLRRLLRRAVRYGREIGLKGFVAEVTQTVIDVYGGAYPNLIEKSTHIIQMLGAEEARFLDTLETGLALLQNSITQMNGADAFKLYDTYGFPPDITREILAENGLPFDQAGFDAEMQAQKDRARAARGVSTYMGADETVYHKLPPNLPTEFTGYESSETEGTILALIADGEPSDEANEGQEVAVVLSRTPFYAASGGQIGDKGCLHTDSLQVEITDCVKVAGDNTVHIGKVTRGTIKVSESITASHHNRNRTDVARNHTATHLLQAALREVVGNHIEQAGSEVTVDRLRFDFTHHAPLTPEQRTRVEARVNEQILSALPVSTLVTTPEEARKQGAVALFGEKYGDTVRMVDINGYSVELCGGTHVRNSVEIGPFKLLSEAGIAAGVRRIEAATGSRAVALYREAADTLSDLAIATKIPQAELPARFAALMAENKELKKEAARRQTEAAKGQIEEDAKNIMESAETYNGFSLIAVNLPDYDIESLRLISDRIKAVMASGCLLLAASQPESGAVTFIASATDDAVKRGIHAGNIVKTAAALCGGNGGGKPNHAQAGGKDASKINEALALGLTQMKDLLK